MADIGLHPSVEKKMYDYLKAEYPEISRFTYEITESKNYFILSGHIKEEFSEEKIKDCSKNIAKIIDGTYKESKKTQTLLSLTFILN
jgi:hypothetical protein